MTKKKQLQRIAGIRHDAGNGTHRGMETLGYLDSLLAQVHLPHRNPVDADGRPAHSWHRSAGRYTITIHAGAPAAADTASEDSTPHAGIPYGAHARLMIAALTRYAKQHKTRTIPMPETPSAFAHQLGLVSGGVQLQLIADQVIRIATSIWYFGEVTDEGAYHQVNTLLCDGFNAAVQRTPGDTGRWRFTAWPRELTLSQPVYDRIIQHGVPIDMRAFQVLSNNARAMDIYAFFVSRLYLIQNAKPVRMSLYDFGMLFEQSPNPDRELLLKNTRNAITQALACYPQAAQSVVIDRNPYEQGRPAYITLRAARPAIPIGD